MKRMARCKPHRTRNNLGINDPITGYASLPIDKICLNCIANPDDNVASPLKAL